MVNTQKNYVYFKQVILCRIKLELNETYPLISHVINGKCLRWSLSEWKNGSSLLENQGKHFTSTKSENKALYLCDPNFTLHLIGYIYKKIVPFLRFVRKYIYTATLSVKFRKIVWEFIQDNVTDFWKMAINKYHFT